MQVISLTEQDISKFFTEDPKLCYLGLPDEDLVSLYQHEELLWSQTSQVFGITENDKLVSIVKWEYFTKNTINLHMYVGTAFQGKKSLDIANFVKEYLRDNTKYLKVLLMVPSTCEHVTNFAKYFGFELEGNITKSYTWRNTLVDILIFSFYLR